MSDTTVIIKTIGRETLDAAVDSALREDFNVIVVSDGHQIDGMWQLDRRTSTVQLGKKWGFYGGMAANVGAAMAPTEFITFLDDDDVFIEGAGDIIRTKMKQRPSVDVWLGGIRFEMPITVFDQKTKEVRFRSTDLGIRPELGVSPTNACMPTYRTSIFATVPFVDKIPEDVTDFTDFFHIKACEQLGYNIRWFNEVLYLVRPGTEKANGRGS